MKRTPEARYLYLCGRIRVLEGRLLSRTGLRRLLEAPATAEALKTLETCGCPLPAEETPAALEESLDAGRRRLFAMMEDLLPDPRLLSVFQTPYDVHNLKVLMKHRHFPYTGPLPLSRCGRLSPEALAAAAEHSDRLLSPPLSEAFRKAQRLLESAGDPLAADELMDAACLSEMARWADETGIPYLRRTVSLLTDAANLRALARRSQALYAGGTVAVTRLRETEPAALKELFHSSPLREAAQALSRADGPMEVERCCDNGITAWLRVGGRTAFGPQPAVTFLMAREMETVNLRLLLTGRMLGIRREVLMKRMRDPYV